MLSAAVHPASVQDRDGAIPLLRAARRLFPFVEVIFADGAYQGVATAAAVAGTGRRRLEIVGPGPGVGSGTFSILSTAGPPNSRTRMAFIVASLYEILIMYNRDERCKSRFGNNHDFSSS